ncbi:fibronectin type III domain-containing protein [Candidatus Woesearchaeota archaeon]|nr:fibronectin type III domain-containing protein [Candidatus Woesearchaeota archaeon]
MKKYLIIIIMLIIPFTFIQCFSDKTNEEQNESEPYVEGEDEKIKPLLDDIYANPSSNSILLNRPYTSNIPNPEATIVAYLNFVNMIQVSDNGTITNYSKGPIDVTSKSYTFSSLNPYKSYEIVVKAYNEAGL